jgi:DNA-binding transcriptional regulator YhcF (GntR family)
MSSKISIAKTKNNNQGEKKSPLSVNVSLSLIRKASQDGFINELAFFYKIKTKFTNSRVYNLRSPIARMAEAAKISRQSVYSYLSKLEALGLVVKHESHWQFISTRQSSRKCQILPTADSTIAEIKNLMFAKLLESEAKHQAFVFALRHFLSDRRNSDKSTPDEPFKFRFSVRATAKLLNVSVNTAQKTLKALRSASVIESNNAAPEFEMRCNREDLPHFEDNFGYRFHSKGKLFKIDPAAHRFNQFKVEPKQITLQRYNRVIKDFKVRRIVNSIRTEIELATAV